MLGERAGRVEAGAARDSGSSSASADGVGVSAPSPSWAHIRELDGLRAIAVLLVFLNHFAPTVSIPRLQIIYEVGWIGVDIFFVLSGFLITGVLLAARDSPGYYRNFYIRRALRIFPLYYALLATMVFGMVIAHGGFAYHRMVDSWGSPAWLFAYLGNIRTALSGVSPPRSFVPMWSLHVEEQFYLLFPFVVHSLSQRALRRTLIVLVVAAPLIRLGLSGLVPNRPLIEYMLLPCRMDGLALGALIALRLRTRPLLVNRWALATFAAALTVAACALFVIGGRSFDTPLERTVGYSLFSLSAASWILWVILFRGSAPTNWLNLRPLQYLGKISYGLYLLQMPAAGLLLWLAGPLQLGPDWLRTAAGSLTLAALCVGLASASWYALERPLLRLKERLAPSVTAPLQTHDDRTGSRASHMPHAPGRPGATPVTVDHWSGTARRAQGHGAQPESSDLIRAPDLRYEGAMTSVALEDPAPDGPAS
jgi:peptidoglycan/LPS O-acetylase OafA/YrhL